MNKLTLNEPVMTDTLFDNNAALKSLLRKCSISLMDLFSPKH